MARLVLGLSQRINHVPCMSLTGEEKANFRDPVSKKMAYQSQATNQSTYPKVY